MPAGAAILEQAGARLEVPSAAAITIPPMGHGFDPMHDGEEQGRA